MKLRFVLPLLAFVHATSGPNLSGAEPGTTSNIISTNAAPEIQPGLARSIPSSDLQSRLDHGRDLYARNCLICHQFNGVGVPGAFPPLAKSDLLRGNLERAVKAVVEGLSGEVVVFGKKINGPMPPLVLNEEEVADVCVDGLDN